MSPVTFVGSLCKIHAEGLLCSKIADVHGIEVHDVRTWKFVYFRKIFRWFLLRNNRDVTRGGKGVQFPGRRITAGGQKSQHCHKHFFKTVHLLPKDLRFEHGGAKLVSCPRCHLTSLRPCTWRLSGRNDEICLQKHLPISGRLLKTKCCLLSKSFDHRK